MGFLTRCKRPFLFAFLLQFCNMLFSFFLKTFLILFEKQHLYKYEVEDNVTDNRGETHVVGHHKKIGLISDSLKKRLLDNGISNKELEEFMEPPKEVG